LWYGKTKVSEESCAQSFSRQRNHFGNVLTSTNQNSREYAIVYAISDSVDKAMCF
jgi:hypothetical protein